MRGILELNWFNDLDLRLINDSDKAEIQISFTPFFTLNDYIYCVIQIKEGKY